PFLKHSCMAQLHTYQDNDAHLTGRARRTLIPKRKQLTPSNSGGAPEIHSSAPNTYTPMNTHSLSRPGFENTNPNQHYHLESDEPRGRQNQVDSKFADCGQKFYFVGGFYRGEGRSEHVTLEIFDILVRNSGKKLKKLKQL
ncbi:hypothetical protein ATANTOWER_009167, partial [Ataeniobius toweri]|nr:hypothetical protein [Ataeniobius toweri]